MDCERPHRTPSSSSTSSTTGSELFICFTSRRLSSSSSSMKISKSILSPGRPRHHDHHPPVSLSTSLSRRLRTNGSLKGGQSPMFPTSAKKRGCAFENPEPSSPKVTCIGQVRVKTRKKVEQTRSLSHRRRSGGEVSFSKAEQPRDMLTQNQDLVHSQTQAENMGGGVQLQQQQQQQLQNQRDERLPHRNQRWVHFPLTICEGLRAFGAEFSCLFPCRSSCFSTTGSSGERDKEAEKSAAGSSEDGNANAQSGSCGAVFARWLVALHDGEGGKPRDIELVVGGRDEERTEVMERPISMNSRRHVLEDIEFKDTKKCEGEEAARVSICIPPKNALLLMRCRSDPMKMASLTNRFWESPARSKELVEEEEVEEKEDKGVEYVKSTLQEEENLVTENGELQQEENEVAAELVQTDVNEEELNPEKDASLEKLEVLENEEKQGQISESKDELQVEIEQEILELLLGKEQEMQEESRMVEAEDELSSASSQANVDEKEAHIQNQVAETTQEKAEQESTAISLLKFNLSREEDGKVEAENAALDVVEAEEQENSTEEKRTQEGYLENETTVTQEKEESSEFHEQENRRADDDIAESEREKEEMNKVNEERESSSRGLPDCLLLMMCEPKLSMEVSKETWVCTTDFIRWLPHNRRTKVNPTDGPDRSKEEEEEEEKKVKVKVSSIESDPALSLLHDKPPAPLQQQPPRSSCSLPATAAAAASMATMIEQKLVNAVACEPFVLTRCKSEPMRSAAKPVPEACFWKNRKLEPHGRATFGFGAAGVGF